MDLAGVYMSKLSANSEIATQSTAFPKAHKDNGFNDILTKINEPAKKESYVDVKNQKNKPFKNKANNNTQKKTEEKTQSNSGTDSAKVDRPTVKTQKLVSGKATPVAEKSFDEEGIISDLAGLFNISEEAIQQIMAVLNITAADLTDRTNLNNFLVELYNIGNTTELLNVPEIMETLTSIREILSLREDTAENVPETEAVSLNNNQTDSDSDFLPKLNDVYTSEEDIPIPADTALKTETNAENTTRGITMASTGIKQNSAVTAGLQNDTASQASNEAFNVVPVANTTANAVSTAAGLPETTGGINTVDVINQITEAMKLEVRGNLTEIKITLKPEHLGDVSLKVATENGIITAQFIAENQRVKEIIEASFNQLRDMLEQQGINVSQLSVSVGQDDSQQRMEQFLKEQQRSGRRVSMILNNTSEALQGQEEVSGLDLAEVYDNNINYAV